MAQPHDEASPASEEAAAEASPNPSGTPSETAMGASETPEACEPARPGLPEPLALALAAYERHLVAERNLTPHTVRAYTGDLRSMLEQAARLGHGDLATIDVRTL